MQALSQEQLEQIVHLKDIILKMPLRVLLQVGNGILARDLRVVLRGPRIPDCLGQLGDVAETVGFWLLRVTSERRCRSAEPSHC